MKRDETRKINVGGVMIGGGAPVTVQSMLNTRTTDIAGSLEQMRRLRAAGCDLVRLAVPDMAAAEALADICREAPMPVVADIHFDYKLAIASVKAGAAKIRINPGNIGPEDNVRAVAEACGENGVPIRIGINAGSLEKDLLQKYGAPTPEAMVESAAIHADILDRWGFSDICLSLKSSDVGLCVAAYDLASDIFPFPLHLGVTEAGTRYRGVIRSAVGIGSLLSRGIGDTIRVSLTDEPEEEVRAGIEILRAAGLRRGGARVISCPTCGRTEIDLVSAARAVEAALEGCERDISVAVMGCVVNGPGEAAQADYGLAGGRGQAALLRRGQVVARVPEAEMVSALLKLIDEDRDTDG